MNDYFDFEDRVMNEDTAMRFEHRPNRDLADAIEYDMIFVNILLNKTILDEADKYNIASVLDQAFRMLYDTTVITKEFEDFTIEVMGKEWHSNLTAKWLQRRTNAIAKQWNMPQMINNMGNYLYIQNKDES